MSEAYLASLMKTESRRQEVVGRQNNKMVVNVRGIEYSWMSERENWYWSPCLIQTKSFGKQ